MIYCQKKIENKYKRISNWEIKIEIYYNEKRYVGHNYNENVSLVYHIQVHISIIMKILKLTKQMRLIIAYLK